MIFDLQISTDTFLDNFSNRIRSARICYIGSAKLGAGEKAYLDRVDFGKPRIEGSLEIIQPVMIRWVTMTALHAAGGNEAAGTEYTCDIHAKCQIENGYLITTLGSIVFNEKWPEQLSLYFENEVIKPGFAFLPPMMLPVNNLSELAGLPEDTVPVTGINVTEGQQAVAIRLEYSATPNMKAWADFHSGKTVNRLSPNSVENFCALIDISALFGKMEQELRAQLEKEMNVNSLSCRWQPNEKGGVIHVAIDATMVDKCEDPFGILGSVDVDVDITAQTSLSIIDKNVLGRDTTYDWDADFEDSARCGALEALNASLMGLLNVFTSGPASALAAQGIAIFILFAIGPIIANYSVELPAEEDCVNGEKRQNCKIKLKDDSTDDGSNDGVAITRSIGIPEGLLLIGKMVHARLVSRPIIDSFNLFPLAAKVQGDCSNMHIAGTGGVVIRYRQSENLTNMVPVEICECYVMNNGPYNPVITPTSISVEYSLAPGKTPTVPCILFFQTNAGTRIFDLGTPDPWTTDLQKKVELQMKLAEMLCDKMKTTWADRVGQAILKYKDWRQPVELDKEMVLWKVILTGGHDSDLIKLATSGKTVAESVVTKGVAELGVILPVASSDIALTIERKDKIGAKESLQATGTLLKPQGTFNIGFVPTQVNFIRGANGLNLEVTDGRRRAVYATRDIAFLSTQKKWRAGEPLHQNRKPGQPMRIGKLAFEQIGKTLSIRPVAADRPAITVNDMQEGMKVSGKRLANSPCDRRGILGMIMST